MYSDVGLLLYFKIFASENENIYEVHRVFNTPKNIVDVCACKTECLILEHDGTGIQFTSRLTS
jgi:hypothetical protein